MSREKNNVCIVVLGDIGRSPRMQYHALSLGEKGHKVDIVGYGETEPMGPIKASPSVFYHYMCPVPQVPLKLLNYAFKTVFQALNLLFLLCTIRRPQVLLVQNPPAIPSLGVCWLFCRIVRAKLIIDWHNYAHTIMALNLSKGHKLVKITEKVEAFFGIRADACFCVTKAMKKDLWDRWNVQATVLYDKPPEIFRKISLKEKHDFLMKLGEKYPEILSNDGSTRFTVSKQGEVALKPDRPGLLVSSTSWTEDEDFSILFSALQNYEDHYTSHKLPDLICFITGKGHSKQFYCDKIKNQQWQHVTVITPWLEPSEYPKIIASADLGVSLHTSSSGLDLPMKVVDMFGCCLPVLAHDFKCLNELAVHGENSYSFSTAEELSEQLLSWFRQFPNNQEQKLIESKFKKELETFQTLRWKENWDQVAYSAFE
ncbi:chitobiosyldiphosphodolichol beta-mannosyltransferase [Anthonomus grandis grandis]|uniref:chitobiosyldiphosphodolichol beta-mannosyltransferase n=1 Tax=Anthonomus grandis grandis TaxID=2921223 RepID=UPI002165CF3A|nr:chitobiosyldiphosphodolichol beta-mannosyltransferase [Anthonomus grandis grandis]